jgi:2-oxoglutarate/2-oxoacid ferredoxin oxidoreductase subunit beta
MISKELENKSKAPLDFSTDQDVRWCPGCGDYSILKQMHTVLTESGLKKEEIVFISGIGCSSRFPYYVDTYGLHSIHGRATAVASGLKASRPDLSVWVITGDGDALSIGGNHLIHMIRRNFNLNVLMFNNEIYGLTKGQYSPTSPMGKVTKSTPMGSIDHPFNPLALVAGADGTFIARSLDRDPKHMREILTEANNHYGTSFVEIYQNCNVFNDGAFFALTEKESKPQNTLFLEHGKPLIFNNATQGIQLQGFTPRIVKMNEPNISANDLWVHDKHDRIKAEMLIRFFDDPRFEGSMPRPFGVFYQESKKVYEDLMNAQVEDAIAQKGEGNLDKLLKGNSSWVIN